MQEIAIEVAYLRRGHEHVECWPDLYDKGAATAEVGDLLEEYGVPLATEFIALRLRACVDCTYALLSATGAVISKQVADTSFWRFPRVVTSVESNYDSYLRSDVWQRTRELALEYYGDKCCLCNSSQNLNVHHRTYERKGHERLADLIVLCRPCHASYHGAA